MSNGDKSVLLAVNGTLMHGLELNANMQKAGATFVGTAHTDASYRCWTISDRHPAMQRTSEGAGGASIALELWDVPAVGLVQILQQEPPGLCVGKVRLKDGREVLGVLGESFLCQGQTEITRFGGWRAYIASRGLDPKTGTPLAQ